MVIGTNAASHPFGDPIGGVTPVPISNTEVKPSRADYTASSKVWETRSSPNPFLSFSYLSSLLSGLFYFILFFSSSLPLLFLILPLRLSFYYLFIFIFIFFISSFYFYISLSLLCPFYSLLFLSLLYL